MKKSEPDPHETDPPLSMWTIGHSTRTIEAFIELLHECRIQTLVDVRHFPGSKRFPHFNKPALQDSLAKAGIHYEHLVELGGRRPVRADSHNIAWRNASFRGYADYMETRPFQEGIERLLRIARASPTAIMCSEAVWWRCHRSMIADDLKARGVQVLHIMGPGAIQEHPYTSPAQLVNGRLSYESAPLFTSSHSQETQTMKKDFKKGDHVQWNSEAGHVKGTIKKKITSEITFKGYTVHASKEEPQYLIESDKTDHMAMHKGSALQKISKPKTKSKAASKSRTTG